jgi:predicted Zn finger-like uncharacterized protein
MMVECPRCGTAYRVPEQRTRRDDASYECARCGHVFGGASDGGEDDGWRDEPEEQAFRFDDDAPPERRRRAKRPERAAPAPAAVAVEVADDDAEEDDAPLDIEIEREPDEAPPARRRRRAAAEDDDTPAGSGVARFALRGLIAVTLAYAVLSVWASTHPDHFERLLGRIPVIGPRLAELPLDPGDVVLRDVRGEYAHLQSGELVFVVRATAANRAARPLRRIRVAGTVRGTEDRSLRASCGDPPADVRKTSRQMLTLMLDMRETRPTPVPPGATTTCEVIFVDPPRGLTDLSLEVVSVVAD